MKEVWDMREGIAVFDYFKEQIQSFFSHGMMFFISVIFGGGLWKSVVDHFAGLIYTDAFFWYPTTWAISWICGTLWALKENRWDRRKATHGAWRLIGGLFMLVIAFIMRQFPTGAWPASFLEIAVVFNELYNGLENAAGLTGIPWLKSLVRTSKAKMETGYSAMMGAVKEVKEQQTVLQAAVEELKPVVEQIQATGTGLQAAGAHRDEQIAALEDRAMAVEARETDPT